MTIHSKELDQTLLKNFSRDALNLAGWDRLQICPAPATLSSWASIINSAKAAAACLRIAVSCSPTISNAGFAICANVDGEI